MKIHRENIDIDFTRPVVTIGMFDGVHRGHMSLIKSVTSKARSISGDSVLITFEPHPRIVLSKEGLELKFLTSLDEKKDLLDKAGVDHLLVLPFTREMSKIPAGDFVKMILVDRVIIHHLIMGFDHHFGHKGLGSHETIQKWAAKYDFGVSRIEALTDKDVTISSTTIRNYLTTGMLKEANYLLGYDYFLKGKVVQGKRIGSKMGYPTANIRPVYPYKLIPSEGVYAVEVLIGSLKYKGMLYIGTRPTLEDWGGEMTVEVNIFDLEDDLYGRDLTIVFKHRLRGDIKFDNTELLYRQIEKDKEDTLHLLG
ncbi:MAG TPA: bifunctional riboflavin kinase/FAD synthetase [Bacteroidales bacterium]|nr:bifunctional riboflavin kinase/FAD synthetase [Bacteroidales bacterium]